MPYWFITGAEVKSVIAAKSILAEAILDKLQTAGQAGGIISFPEDWTDFKAGNFQHAMNAISFKIEWVSLEIGLILTYFNLASRKCLRFRWRSILLLKQGRQEITGSMQRKTRRNLAESTRFIRWQSFLRRPLAGKLNDSLGHGDLDEIK